MKRPDSAVRDRSTVVVLGHVVSPSGEVVGRYPLPVSHVGVGLEPPVVVSLRRGDHAAQALAEDVVRALEEGAGLRLTGRRAEDGCAGEGIYPVLDGRSVMSGRCYSPQGVHDLGRARILNVVVAAELAVEVVRLPRPAVVG